MNCLEARDLLLEADRAELFGEANTELGRHVATCPECSALARQFHAAESSLDRALARRSERTRPRRLLPLATWSALAAALVVFMLLPRQHPAAGRDQRARQPEWGAADVDVSSDAGRTAVVLRTADPGITVVWFFQN